MTQNVPQLDGSLEPISGGHVPGKVATTNQPTNPSASQPVPSWRVIHANCCELQSGYTVQCVVISRQEGCKHSPPSVTNPFVKLSLKLRIRARHGRAVVAEVVVRRQCLMACPGHIHFRETMKRPSTQLDSTWRWRRWRRWNKLSSLITAIINAVKFNNLNTFISIYHPEATTSAKIERLTLLLLLGLLAFWTGLSSSSEIETSAALLDSWSWWGWIVLRWFGREKIIRNRTLCHCRWQGWGGSK